MTTYVVNNTEYLALPIDARSGFPFWPLSELDPIEPPSDTCPVCEGAGGFWYPAQIWTNCNRCHGTGTSVFDGFSATSSARCSACDGTGKITRHDLDQGYPTVVGCPACSGAGTVSRNDTGG